MKTELFIIGDDGSGTKINATNIIIEMNNSINEDYEAYKKEINTIYKLMNYHENNYIDVPILTHKQRQPHYQKFNRVKR